VFSRIVGYLRPVSQWNDGKKAEFKLRTTFDPLKQHDKSLEHHENSLFAKQE
jgi:ribonucleoside-triphosphate reductase